MQLGAGVLALLRRSKWINVRIALTMAYLVVQGDMIVQSIPVRIGVKAPASNARLLTVGPDYKQ